MISLKNFDKPDFGQLITWINDEALLISWSGGLFKFPLTEESLEWYISDTNIPGKSDAFVYKAVDEQGNTIGHISLGGISWKNRSARITRVLVGDTERSKGACQQMVKAILRIGFEELKLHRIGLGVYDSNPAAIRCYEKSGLRIEGIKRDVLWFEGKWMSMVEMAILENDWRSLEPAP